MPSSSPPDQPERHGVVRAPTPVPPDQETPAGGKPAVTVVIPAWNEERFIGGALASLAAQTLPPDRWEAIVVDNGSTDGTAAGVRAFQAAHPDCRLRLLQLGCRGRAIAKNAGARAAAGRLLVFLDADSQAEPRLLAETVASADRGWTAGSIRIVADTPSAVDRGFFALMEFGKERFGVRAQMFYCERSLFLAQGGFAEGLEIAEDLDFLRRVQRADYPVCHMHRSWILTSPRRLRALPLRLGVVITFARWVLADVRIGRRWRY